MNFLSIKEWRQLAEQDPLTWSTKVREKIGDCKVRAHTPGVSWDLSQRCSPMSGVWSGVPYGAKELFDVKGWPSHSSSVLPELIRKNAESDSAVVERMNQLGATCAAKTQMNEFAYGLSGENPHYGNCPHPQLEGCLTGGSSSGSAYLVAAGYVPIALGTDTGGSIRLPAAWCGLYGLRTIPGYMMEGCFPLAPSFDTIGWFTRSAEDMRTAIVDWFNVKAGSTNSDALSGGALIPEDLVDADVFRKLSEVVQALGIGSADTGASLHALMPESNVAFNVLQSTEAYELHAKWLELYGDYYDPAVKARILRGAHWTDEDYAKAAEMRATVTAWFDAYFESHDFLVMPVCPRSSVPVSEASGDLREKLLRMTAPASLAQKPALTVPVTLSGAKTVGLQFIFKDLDPMIPLKILDLCKNI